MSYINLNNMKFVTCHGVLDAEKITPQEFTIDVKIATNAVEEAAKTDNINDALNYVTIFDLVYATMMDEQYDLIETIALTIAKKIVKNHEKAINAEVKVTKNNPPINGFTGTVSCIYTAFRCMK